ncbi:MAG: 3-hydroxyacyl-CoA dehydrogenase family protein [Clostridia bacterium]|jgi:3-hydroxybutyryl-CoA dehydrogenase|nr:3-hydroxyacyl-CoA dehydrogenase family protein [Clostridia bacterium]
MAVEVGKIKNVGIIGAGLMGSGIALIFASKGYKVNLFDSQEKALPQAIANIQTNLGLMAENGIGCKNEIDSIVSNIHTTLAMEEAVLDTQFIIECVSENLELKQQIFRKLDAITPEDVILATNTSVISITEISQLVLNKERIVGTHFWNPPFLIPLVEVIRADHTSDEVMNTTFNLMKLVGKHPIRVNKDVPGFVANRLQHALWREAISIVERGIADAATVDESIRYGFGLRLPILGPMENADMVGTDLTLAIHEYILKHLENSPEPSKLLKEKVNIGELGFKTGTGFQNWSPADIQQSKTKLIQYLLKVNKDL